MSTWIYRLSLARQGWTSQLRLTRHGVRRSEDNIVAAGFWAKTWYWSGGISDICLHDHAMIDLNHPDANAHVAAIIRNVGEAVAC